jgi:hypothetical protein
LTAFDGFARTVAAEFAERELLVVVQEGPRSICAS